MYHCAQIRFPGVCGAMKTGALWGCLLLALLYRGCSGELKCSTHPASRVKFALTSLRNQTGHWIAQVQLEHGADQEDATDWEVGIDHTVTPQCDGSESVLVEVTITAPPNRDATVTSKCQRPPPKGYRRLSDCDHFKVYPEPSAWVEARDICEREGAHLAIINSEAEAKFVSSLWNFKSGWAYIGTHDLYEEGKYVTIHNQTLQDAGYNEWYEGEPNGGTSENCGVINHNTQLGNYFCNRPLPFFCELEA